ncbi:MAG: pantoate--beta-alanine ligase [bacterium]
MERLTSPDAMRAWTRARRGDGEEVAFVPTMGALHAGHLSLVDTGRERADRVAVSIFVNPAQFGPEEDLESYPLDMEGDLRVLDARGADAVFTPEVETMYPPGASTWVVETDLSARLEGAARPGHFRGVTTVVTKLLEAVGPDLLVMGQKDAQQAAVVRRMVRDLLMPVEVVTSPIVRGPDGLALSSRNAYLAPAERAQAVCLYQALQHARERVREGAGDPEDVLTGMRRVIETRPDARVDYVAAVDPDTFRERSRLSGETLFLVAAFVGRTRLIDNELVQEG